MAWHKNVNIKHPRIVTLFVVHGKWALGINLDNKAIGSHIAPVICN